MWVSRPNSTENKLRQPNRWCTLLVVKEESLWLGFDRCGFQHMSCTAVILYCLFLIEYLEWGYVAYIYSTPT